MITVGLDLSLTGTGVVILKNSKLEYSELIKSKPAGKRPKDELIRIVSIADRIENIIKQNTSKVDIVVIENLAFGVRNATALTQLAGLNYFVRHRCLLNHWPFLLVAPTTLKRFLTGHGNAQKDVMMLEVYKKYGETFLDDNLCDAYVLAQVGVMFGPNVKNSGVSKSVMDLISSQLN